MYNVNMNKQYKEDYLYLFLRGINISKKDYSFFSNINLIVKGTINRKFITANQAKLFDKLVVKYRKQLDKEIHDATMILNSPWKTLVVNSSDEYKIPKLYIEGNTMYFKVPYNSKFKNTISENNLSWNYDKFTSTYRIEFNTLNFKKVHDSLIKHFGSYNGCNQVNEILEYINQYSECKYWTPTLIERFGRYYIAGINETLYEKLEHIELNEDFNTLNLLAQHGIKVDESITNKDFKKKFASDFIIYINIDEVEEIIELCNKIGLTHICFSDYDVLHVNKKAFPVIQKTTSSFARAKGSNTGPAFLCLFDERAMFNIKDKLNFYSYLDIKKVICIYTT